MKKSDRINYSRIAFNTISRRQILKTAGGFVAGVAAGGGLPLIANSMASGSTTLLAQAQISGLLSVSLVSGTIISLECLGDIPDDRYRYLDGRTGDGIVALAPSNEGIYTGTKWRVDRRQSTSVGTYYTLYCLGTISGSNYLDGDTRGGTVRLAVGYGEGRYTGARWQVYTDGSSYLFYCLGTVEGSKWLDGITRDGEVMLASSYEGLSGTRWRLIEQA